MNPAEERPTDKGIDTESLCEEKALELKQAGYHFIARYYNQNNPHKNLTKTEAQALTQAGLYIVAVWENGYPTSVSYFSQEVGESDATSAYNYAKHTIGQPKDSTIYFAVDFDASPTDLSEFVHHYFQKIIDTFKELGNEYHIGVYGSGLTCEYILKNFSEISYTWLAESSGWSNSRTFEQWNIKQVGSGTEVGFSVDFNEAQGDGGGFRLES